MEQKIFYYRNLPHYQPAQATFFVTYRLVDSLPLSVIRQLKEDFYREQKGIRATFTNVNTQKDEIYLLRKKYFGKFDEHLHKNLNEPYWLQDDRIAEIVAGSLHFLAQRYFELWAYCIMPNHVHILISMFADAPILYEVMQKHKGFTGMECNKILHRNGQFWTHESYDHVVRKNGEFGRILTYILNNPVKAGFIDNWQDWQGSYLNPKM